MDMGLNEKTAVITGGSAGIGLACARALASEGCRIVLVARDHERLERAADQIRSDIRAEVHTVAADLASTAGIARMIEEAHHRLRRLDILINNAGAIRAGGFLETPDEQWMEDWNLKLLGYVRAARAVFPLMRAQGGGCIVNVVGSAAREVGPTYLAGGAANAALVNFTKGLSDLGAAHKVYVRAVSPGAVATERWESIVKRDAVECNKPYAQLRAERIAATPLGRIVLPEEVADLVCFLASARAQMINGVSVCIDGGASRGVYL